MLGLKVVTSWAWPELGCSGSSIGLVRLLLSVVVLPKPCLSENTFREGEQNSHAQAVTILFPVRLDSAAQPATLPRCLEGRPNRSQPVMVLRHLLKPSLSKDWEGETGEASQPKRPIATREACAWAKWLTVATWRAFVLIVRYVKYKQRGST